MAQRLLRTQFLHLVCFFLVLQTSVFGQRPSTLQFQKTYSGVYSETPSAMQQTSDGGYIMLGQTLVSIPDTLAAQSGIRLIRMEEDGSIRWSKSYGGSRGDFGYDVMETLDEGFLIAGQTENASEKHRYAYLIKTDKLGQKQWSKVFTAIDGVFQGLTLTKDGNYLAIGHGNQHLFAVKIDIRGNHIWTQTYEMDYQMSKPIVKTCIADGNEGFAIAGTADHRFFLLRIQDNGKPLWVKSYANTAKGSCTGLVETSEGGFLLTGTNYRQSGSSRNAKMAVIKTDREGIVKWANAYGGKGNDFANSVAKYGRNGFLIGGYTSSFGTNSQMAMLRLAQNGQPIDVILLGAGGSEEGGWKIQATKDEGAALLGRTNGFKLKNPAFYFVKMDKRGFSGGNTSKARMQVRSFSVKTESHKLRTMPNRYQRDVKYIDCPTETIVSSVREQLLCGNVTPVFDPRAVVQAKARARDSMALVALYNSANGPEWEGEWDLQRPMSAWESIKLDKDGRVMSVILIANRLSGTLPPEIGNLSKLRFLWLANNQLSGNIPAELGKLKYLEELLLDHNQFSGIIPAELAKLEELQELRLDHNELTGSIPIEFGQLTKLREFRINNNQLTGNLPPELSNLPMTAQLDLSNNQFSGGIPKAIFELENAEMKNNSFAPHAKAKLAGEMGGQYTYNDMSGDSYVLILNDEIQRFTLMKGVYGDEGGKYVMVKGKFEWNEKGVFLHGELLETGIMGDSATNKKTKTEAYKGQYALEFEEREQSKPMKVKLRAFDTELQLEKTQ